MYRAKKVLMTQFTFICLILASSSILSGNPNNITVTKSDETGISFNLSYADDEVKPQKIEINGQEYTVFNIVNTVLRNQAGMPDIPSQEIVIGIAQDAEISVSAQVNSSIRYKNIKIPPVPYQTFEGFKDYRLTDEFKSDLYPQKIWEISNISYFRDNRIARIKIYPLQYNNLTQEAVLATDISVAVRFSKPVVVNPRPDYFDGVYNDIVINGAQSVHWKSDITGKLNLNRGYSKYPSGFTNWFKIKIESTGVYKISYNELKQAGLPVNMIDPRTIRLFNIGEYIPNVNYPDTMTEIPISVVGEDDSTFNKQDYLLFFGVAHNRYNRDRAQFVKNVFTNYNYYWLTWGFSAHVSGFGKRFTAINSIETGNRKYWAENKLHLEKDRDCPARNGLLWIWDLFSKENGVANKSFDLPVIINKAESLISFSGRFYGQTSSNWIRVGLNNVIMDSFSFSGWSTNPPPYDFTTNRKIVLPESSVVNFQLYNFPNQEVFFDYFDFRYQEKLEFPNAGNGLSFYSIAGDYDFVIRNALNKPIILDISNYFEPKIIRAYQKNRDTLIFGVSLADTAYYYFSDETRALNVTSIERKNPGQAMTYTGQNYYIIAADELFESAKLFENYRANNVTGINQAKVKAVALSRIYDDFTFGIEEPGAIKRLFKKNQPYYGLLLGDGTYDYRNILGLANFPAVPAYESGYDIDFQVYSTGAISIDAWYADFDGLGASPDMALGRITARTSAEARRYFDKLVNYESNQTSGLWNKRFLFLSDDEWKGQGAVDEFGFEHISNNENLENNLFNATSQKFRHYEPVKVYLTEYPFSETRDKRKAREALLAELSKGVSLWCYFGHGAGFQLAHEQALNIVHVPQVNTNRRNFISFYGSCGVGRFEDTKFESVAEELVRKADAGIASIGASKATYSGVNYSFANIFFSRLINQPDSTLGQAFLRGWFVDSSYHLFGEPAVKPALPNNFENLTVMPDTFNAGQIITASNYSAGNSKFAVNTLSSKWRRQYSSSVGTIFYNLNGYEVFRNFGNIVNETLNFGFMIPTGLPRQFRYDIINGSGFYTEVPKSVRVSAITFTPGQKTIHSYLKDTIVFDTLDIVHMDNSGPLISFFNGDKRIQNNAKLPKQFELTTRISDSSGILLAPVVGFNPRLILKKQPNRILEDADVSAYFNYDINNYYQGRVVYPIVLDTGKCLITLKISDNLRNMSTDSVEVTVERSQNLVFTNVLYYASPSTRNGYFTFEISKPAEIDVKIYTITGRLVRTISNRFCSFGYNQIDWDGLDQYGQIPANGVYLYKITGRAFDANREDKQAIIDKFIILH